jgi:hypothetical protein
MNRLVLDFYLVSTIDLNLSFFQIKRNAVLLMCPDVTVWKCKALCAF